MSLGLNVLSFLPVRNVMVANSWHVATWLIKLSPVVICDECWPKLGALGPKWLLHLTYGSEDGHRDCSAEMATEGILRASESLRKESDKLGPLNSQLKSWSESHRASMIAHERSLISYSHQTYLLQVERKYSACCWMWSVEFSLTKLFLWLRRNGTLKLGMDTSGLIFS